MRDTIRSRWGLQDANRVYFVKRKSFIGQMIFHRVTDNARFTREREYVSQLSNDRSAKIDCNRSAVLVLRLGFENDQKVVG